MRAAQEYVVGYDGSDGSRDALALAVPLARLFGAGVHVVTAYSPAVIGGRQVAAKRELAAARTAAEGARCIEGVVACRSSEVRAAGVAAPLQRLAESPTTRCVVVGRPHSPVHIGTSVTHKVLTGCSTSVAVPRRHLVPRPQFARVVLAVAGSPGAGTLAGRQIAHLADFFSVLPSTHSYDIAVYALIDRQQQGVLHAIDQAAELLSMRLGVHVGVLTGTGGQLVDQVDSADVVVRVGDPFGAHGCLQAGAFNLRLLHGAGPTLLVVPPRPRDAVQPGLS